MRLDRARLTEVLDADYGYYHGPEPTCWIDDRLMPSTDDFIASQLCADMSVLDAGCGNGATLLRYSGRFAHAVGVDNDQAHIDLAVRARESAGVGNVQFVLGDLNDLTGPEWDERFDYVFSERGPVGYGIVGVQAALRMLRTDGLIFSELIGELHHQEVREIFGGGPRRNQRVRALDQAAVAMERSGVNTRVAADFVTKRHYPDIYEWLKFQCGIWAWAGGSLPSPDDPRLALFAERNCRADGSVEVTHHVAWAGGVKLAESPYGEGYAAGSARRADAANREHRR